MTLSNTPTLDDMVAQIRVLHSQETLVGRDEQMEFGRWSRDEYADYKERFRQKKIELDEKLAPRRLPLRVERGRLLIEARVQVRGSWEEWCKRKFAFSLSDIRACIKLAEASDPIAAHETEKAKAAARQRKSRATKSAVTSPPVTAVPTVSPSDWTAAAVPSSASEEPADGEIELRADEEEGEEETEAEKKHDQLWARAKADREKALEEAIQGMQADVDAGRLIGNAPLVAIKVIARNEWQTKALENEPTTPEEATFRYNAISWEVGEIRQRMWQLETAQGKVIEDAKRFFPNGKGWKAWVKSHKTCPGTSSEMSNALYRVGYDPNGNVAHAMTRLQLLAQGLDDLHWQQFQDAIERLIEEFTPPAEPPAQADAAE